MSELRSSYETRLFLILPEEMTCRWSINCQVYCWVPLAHNFRNDLMARICNSWSVHAILFFWGMYMQFLKWLAADPLMTCRWSIIYHMWTLCLFFLVNFTNLCWFNSFFIKWRRKFEGFCWSPGREMGYSYSIFIQFNIYIYIYILIFDF